jgi:putative endonuclease
MKRANWFWIYMIECDNGALYTGYTNNLARRYRQHLDGTANVRYTRSYKPVRLAQCWRLFDTVGTALKVESLIKRAGIAVKRRLLVDRDVTIAPFDAAEVEKAARGLAPGEVKDAADPFALDPPTRK